MKKIITIAFVMSLLSLAACSSKVIIKDVPVSQEATVTPITNEVTTTTEPIVGDILATTTPPVTYDIATPTIPIVGIANPAANNCVAKGGSLRAITRSDGNQYTICDFTDNRQCEEWALFRGECPVGGLKITGYDNDAQIFCAITGGTVDMAKNTCTFKGNVCDLKLYYDGICF